MEREHPVFQVKLYMIIPPQYSFVYNTPPQSSPLRTVLSTRQSIFHRWDHASSTNKLKQQKLFLLHREPCSHERIIAYLPVRQLDGALAYPAQVRR